MAASLGGAALGLAPFPAHAEAAIETSAGTTGPNFRGIEHLPLLRQIVAARSFHRSSHRPTQVLTGQAELAVAEATAGGAGGRAE